LRVSHEALLKLQLTLTRGRVNSGVMPLLVRTVLAVCVVATSAVVANSKGLCDRVAHIKIIPYGDESGRDADYDALIAAGKAVVPCLIQRVADTRPMRDPREGDPGYAGITYRVGDTAFFVVGTIMKIDYPKLLPSSYQGVWKDSGVFAYFKYVQRSQNRSRLQRRLRGWYRNVYLPSLRTSAAQQLVGPERRGRVSHQT
jgi:hypothetical protein